MVFVRINGWLMIVWKVVEVYGEVELVKKSASTTSCTTAGPETGFGTIVSLIWKMYSAGGELVNW